MGMVRTFLRLSFLILPVLAAAALLAAAPFIHLDDVQGKPHYITR
jgi:hypothetical protein